MLKKLVRTAECLEDLVFPMYLLLLPFILAYVCFLIFGSIEPIKSNEHVSNSLSVKYEFMKEGIVIEKEHKDASTYFVTNYVDNVPVSTPITDRERFILTIYGKENGKKIEKEVEVSEKEYNSFKIGDTYKFKTKEN